MITDLCDGLCDISVKNAIYLKIQHIPCMSEFVQFHILESSGEIKVYKVGQELCIQGVFSLY